MRLSKIKLCQSWFAFVFKKTGGFHQGETMDRKMAR